MFYFKYFSKSKFLLIKIYKLLGMLDLFLIAIKKREEIFN